MTERKTLKTLYESFIEDLIYYYAEGTTPIGPLSLKTLLQKNINDDTLIWKVGMEDWKPAKCFSELDFHINQ